MPFIVEPAVDADIARACEIEFAAHAGRPANSVKFPGPFPPDSAARRAQSLIDERNSDPTTRHVKAVDQETGEIIAFSKWHIYATPEEAEKAERPLNFGEGTNREACMAFFGGIARRKKELMGSKPHICS